MDSEKNQKDWGWLIVLYVFLAGLGGGTFLFSFVMIRLERFAAAAHAGVLLGPLSVLVGSAMLVFDLGSPKRFYRLFTTPATLLSSWMVRGAWILSAFIVLGIAYALPFFGWFPWLPWDQASLFGDVLGFIAAALSVVVMVYPGLLLGVIRSIPLWNTSALPLVFLVSGLDTGVGGFVLISLSSSNPLTASEWHLLGAIDGAFILLLLVALGAYMEIVRQNGVTGALSIRSLASPLFLLGVVTMGLLVPLSLLGAGIIASGRPAVALLDGLAGALVLAGGLTLRFCIVKSGVRILVR